MSAARDQDMRIGLSLSRRDLRAPVCILCPVTYKKRAKLQLVFTIDIPIKAYQHEVKLEVCDKCYHDVLQRRNGIALL